MERVPLSEDMLRVLASRDDSPVVCDHREFCLDEIGRPHLVYYDSEGKKLRDFMIPSDKPDPPTQTEVLTQLERTKAAWYEKYSLPISIGIIAVLIVVMTVFEIIHLKGGI